MSTNTPVCDGIAAGSGRYLLRGWLEIAKSPRGCPLDIERIYGYLDCLLDLQLITDTERLAARAELGRLLDEMRP